MKSGRLFVPVLAGPASLALLVWGFGGEDPFWASVAGGLLCAAGLVSPGGVAAGVARLAVARPAWMWPALGLGVLASMSLRISVNRFVTQGELLFVATLGFWSCALLGAGRRANEWTLAGCVAVAALASGYGMGQMMGIFPRDFWHNGLFASRFVNSVHYAALAAAAFPAGVGLWLDGPRGWPRAVAAATVPLNAAGLLLSGSRAVWLSGLVVYAVFVGLAVRGSRHIAPRDRARRRMVLTLAVACLVAGAAVLAPRIGSRFADLGRSRAQSVTQRLDVWQDTLAMIRHKPLGVGAGCFGDAYLAYKGRPDRFTAARAHNEMLQVTAELGWPAAPLGVGFVVGWALEVFRGVKRAGPGHGRILALAAAAAAGVLLLHSLVDFPLRLRADALFLWVVLWVSVPAAEADRGAGRAGETRRPAHWALVATGALMTLAWAGVAVSSWHRARAERLMDQGRFRSAMVHLDRARNWMPSDPGVAAERGRVLYAWSCFAPPARRVELLGDAARELEWAARLASGQAETHSRLARVRRARGEKDAAERSLRRAIECDPTLGSLYWPYAEFLLSEGRGPEAAAVIERGLEMFHDNRALACKAGFRLLRAATGDTNAPRRVGSGSPARASEPAGFPDGAGKR